MKKAICYFMTAIVFFVYFPLAMAAETPESVIAAYEAENPNVKEITGGASVSRTGYAWNDALFVIDKKFNTEIIMHSGVPSSVTVTFKKPAFLSDAFIYFRENINKRYYKYVKIYVDYEDGSSDLAYDFADNPQAGMLRLPRDCNTPNKSALDENITVKKAKGVTFLKPRRADATNVPPDEAWSDADNQFQVSELIVYAKKSEDAVHDAWRVTNAASGEQPQYIACGETYRFSSYSINESESSDQKRVILLTVTDRDGIVLNTAYGEVYIEKNTEKDLWLEIFIPEGAYKVSASLLDNLENSKALINGISLYAGPPETETSQTSAPENPYLTSERNGFKINFTPGGDISVSDKIIFLVLKPGETEWSPGGLCAAGYTDFPPNGERSYYVLNMAAEAPAGKYKVKATAAKTGGETLSYEFTWRFMSENEIAEETEKFRDVSADAFAELLKQANGDRWIFTDNIAAGEDAEKLSEYFVFARDAAKAGLTGLDFSQISSVGHISALLRQAWVFYSLDNSAETEIIEKYRDSMPGLIEPPTDTVKFTGLYKSIAARETTAEKICAQIERIAVLSRLWKESRETASQILASHGEILDIDLNYAKNKGVELLEVLKYLDTNNVSGYLNGMSRPFNAAADKAASAKLPAVSGGGGGGGGGGTGTPVIYVPSENAEIPNITPDEAPRDLIFNDLKGFEWADEAVTRLFSLGIIHGAGEKTFEPQRSVTRAEFVKMLVIAFDIKAVGKEGRIFDDCEISDWYYPYIKAAYLNTIIKGVSAELFGANSEITREDASVICNRVMEYKGRLASGRSVVNYADSDDISEYAKTAVADMYEAGIFRGYENNAFLPKNYITRAEAAVAAYRLLQFFDE